MSPNPTETKTLHPHLRHEQALWANGALWIAGIDEAGRGALAGPVAAAAVILPQIKTFTRELAGVRELNDHREPAPGMGADCPSAGGDLGVGLASAQEIDQFGILPATRLAACRALAQLAVSPDHLLLDYLHLPEIPTPQTSLVKGDLACLSIAAASVLAKTSRDAILCELDASYPGYGFCEHKGYGTVAHQTAIKELGPAAIHRMSFAPLRYLDMTDQPHPSTKAAGEGDPDEYPENQTPIRIMVQPHYTDQPGAWHLVFRYRLGSGWQFGMAGGERSGRGVLVVQPTDGQAPRDLNADYNIRAGVGYGGGDFTVGQGQVYFVEAKSGRIYRQPTQSGTARAITPAFGAAASPALAPTGDYLLFVHTLEDKDVIGIVDTDGAHWPQKLVSGDDFYMQPCWHPSGDQVAWIAWNHPNMPWDGTQLKTAMLSKSDQGLPTLQDSVIIAGGEDISIFQPTFSPDGRYLAYVADDDGWWHLYLHDLESGEVREMTGGEAEHAEPAWVQGQRTFAFSPDGKSIYFIRSQDGFRGLWRVDVESKMKERVRIGSDYTWLNQIAVAPQGDRVAVIASGGRTPARVISYDSEVGTRVLRRSLAEDLPPRTYALPQAITWEGMDGGLVHGIFYAPQSQTFAGIGLPPLLVLVHGGPTGQRGAHFDGQAQFFASRGWGVLQVNYRGSAGYGRAYRDALKGQWGIHDVQDSVSGAQYLVNDGLVDGSKVVIMGGSAGGFTVLKALEDHPGFFFKAGVNLFGVANQFTLAADTHKFEAHYSDTLLGSLPEAADIYRERSPLFYAHQIQDPVIVFQGEDDKVVPPNQSDEIVAALQRNGVPHEYHRYPGEGHGFRQSETIEKFYNSLLKFLSQYVIFG